MNMIWRQSCLRLGVVPVIALAVNLAIGSQMPFMIPMFCIILLMLSPKRLPVNLILKLLLVVVCCSALVSLLARLVGSNPLAFWLLMSGLVISAFTRLGRKPSDLPGLLALIVSTITMVIVQINPDLVLAIPTLIGSAFFFAYLWSLLAFALWPLSAPPLSTPTVISADIRPLSIVGKSLALLLAVGFAIWLQDSSAILIGATIANLLRSSDPHLTRMNSLDLLKSNLLAAILAIPIILLAFLTQTPLILLLLALAGGLWLAGRLAMGWSSVLVQTALTVYITLLGTALPQYQHGVYLVWDRVGTLLLAVLYCALVIRLLERSDKQATDQRESISVQPDL